MYLLQEKSKIPLFDIFEILWELWKTSKITLFSRFCCFLRFCELCQKLVWDICWGKFVTFSGTFVEKIFFSKIGLFWNFNFLIFNYRENFWIQKNKIFNVDKKYFLLKALCYIMKKGLFTPSKNKLVRLSQMRNSFFSYLYSFIFSNLLYFSALFQRSGRNK